MFDIHFGQLQYWYFALAFVIFVLLHLVVRWYKRWKAIDKLVCLQWKYLLLTGSSWSKIMAKKVLFFVGSAALSLAFLQPQWDKKNEVIAQAGRDIIIAIDVSRSMLGQDLKPNRLEFAKNKIKKILANLSCERVGLLLFSGDSVMQCPLTKDYATFFMFLDQLDVETISSGTTAIQGAIKTALEVFSHNPDQKTKLLAIFTDGEDFSSNLAGFKEQAAKEHLAIFTFGTATVYGAPIPVIDYTGKQVGFEKDSSGNIIMSKLNEEILQHISDQTGGQYIAVTPNSDADIKRFVGLVSKFEKDSLQDSLVNRLQEQYPYFVGISLICFLLEWLL